MKFLWSLVFSCFIVTAFASEPAQWQSDGTYQETSNKITQSALDLTYRNNRRNFKWPYPGAKSRAHDIGVASKIIRGRFENKAYQGYRLRGIYARKFNNNSYYELSPGFHTLKFNDSKESTVPSAKSTLINYFMDKDLIVEWNEEYDYYYQRLQMPGGLTDEIKTLISELKGKYRMAPATYASIGLRHELLSGSNQRREIYTSFEQNLHFKPLNFFYGLSLNYLNFKEPNPNYWTPQKTTSAGISVGVEKNLTKNLDLSISSSPSLFEDLQTEESGWDHYSTFNIKYGKRDKNQVYLKFVRMDSYAPESHWYENDILLGLTLFN